jgi:hypothetical protein
LLAQIRVKFRKGFVQQQGARLRHQRALQRDAGPLPAGQGGRVAVGEPVEAHLGERVLNMLLPRRASFDGRF